MAISRICESGMNGCRSDLQKNLKKMFFDVFFCHFSKKKASIMCRNHEMIGSLALKKTNGKGEKMGNCESALLRLGSHPEVRNAIKAAAVGTAQSVLAPAAGGFLTELGLTSAGAALTSIGGGTAVATASAAVGAVLAPVAIGAGILVGIGWLCSKCNDSEE